MTTAANATKPTVDAVRGDFLDTIRKARAGNLAYDLTANLQELVESIVANGKKGKLTLTLDISPVNTGDASSLVINDTIKITKPTPPKRGSIFYPTRENTLVRENPNQMQLPMDD